MRMLGENNVEFAARMAKRRARIVALWPRMSAVEIGIELGMTAQAVLSEAIRAGMPSRPIAAVPIGRNSPTFATEVV